MRATCRFGRSLTVANPKEFPQEVPSELHLWLTAWSLGHERVEFEFEKKTFFLVSFSSYKIAGGIAPEEWARFGS